MLPANSVLWCPRVPIGSKWHGIAGSRGCFRTESPLQIYFSPLLRVIAMTAVSEADDGSLFAREFEVESLNTVLKFYQKEIGDVSCVIWDASLVLARYLEKRAETNPSSLKGLKIVELGAGVGCVGILAACFGADVTMTDLPSVLPLLERNICVNKDVWSNAGGCVSAHELSWGKTKSEINPPSLLLLADCVYYTESIVPLVQTMKELSNKDTEIIICQEERDTDKQRMIWKEFKAELGKHFKFTAVPSEEQHPLFRSPDILLLRGSRLI